MPQRVKWTSPAMPAFEQWSVLLSESLFRDSWRPAIAVTEHIAVPRPWHSLNCGGVLHRSSSIKSATAAGYGVGTCRLRSLLGPAVTGRNSLRTTVVFRRGSLRTVSTRQRVFEDGLAAGRGSRPITGTRRTPPRFELETRQGGVQRRLSPMAIRIALLDDSERVRGGRREVEMPNRTVRTARRG